MKQFPAIIALLLLLGGCGDPDETSGTPENEVERDSSDDAPLPEALDSSAGGSGGTQPDSDLVASNDPDAVPEETPEYVGLWAANIAWCANTSGEKVPINITRGTFEGYENVCTFESVNEKRQHVWEAELSCTAEGRQDSRRITMAANRNVLIVTYHDIGDQGVSYSRCLPERPEPE